jgi:phage gp37-like protein
VSSAISPIAAIEDAILAHLAAAAPALPYKIVEMESYAGQLDEQLDQVIRRMPAVWVAFAGHAKPRPVGTSKTKFRIDATFAVMHGARNARGEKFTRHGLELGGLVAEVGAYRILADVGALLLRQDFADTGLEIEPLSPGRVATLYNTRLAREGLAVFSQEWHTAWIMSLPDQPLDPLHPDALWEALGIHYHLIPDDGIADAVDELTLEP